MCFFVLHRGASRRAPSNMPQNDLQSEVLEEGDTKCLDADDHHSLT